MREVITTSTEDRPTLTHFILGETTVAEKVFGIVAITITLGELALTDVKKVQVFKEAS